MSNNETMLVVCYIPESHITYGVLVDRCEMDDEDDFGALVHELNKCGLEFGEYTFLHIKKEGDIISAFGYETVHDVEFESDRERIALITVYFKEHQLQNVPYTYIRNIHEVLRCMS